MKTALLTVAIALMPALAMGGPGHGKGEGMAIGRPAETAPTRTVKVVMNEDYDGEEIYVFDREQLTFAAGETVRLHIANEGQEVHEFVMDTVHANAEHKAMMERFPEMEHDDPNAVRLEPGEEAEIVWTFGEAGTFEFACLLPGHYENGMHGHLIVN